MDTTIHIGDPMPQARLHFPPLSVAGLAGTSFKHEHFRAIVDEGKSINTIENIRNVRALVGGGRVALVTSGNHMPRALQLAARAKLDVSPFPTDFRSRRSTRATWDNWIFSGDALDLSTTALREIIAMNLDIRARALGE